MQSAMINAAGRALASHYGFSVVDLDHLMRGQERYLDADGYHWPRYMNLRIFELIATHLHVDFVREHNA
jgi:hypothetical protein